MKFASAGSTETKLSVAVDETLSEISARLDGKSPDLAVVFVSEHFQSVYEEIPSLVARRLGNPLIIGCSAGGVIGGGQEFEHQPAFSVTAAILPDVTVTLFHIESEEKLPSLTDRGGWEDLLGIPFEKKPHFLLLPDPFTFDAEAFLKGLDHIFPQSKKIGGMASAAHAPGQNALFLGNEIHRSGLVGVAFQGNIEVDTIVAQGCRPIGSPMFITRCDRNVVQTLDGRPAMEVLEELYGTLGERDQELFRRALFLGLVMRRSKQEYRQGDFLIRNLMGADQNSGSLIVGSMLEPQMVVQFHLRDAETSSEDLSRLLSQYKQNPSFAKPLGSLLFSCLGRGIHLYHQANHDSDTFRQQLGDVPLGGFFCNGEIGPVQDQTFIHGYTSAFGLFRNRY